MAEKKKPFDLGDALADILGNAPGSDTGREQITYLDINAIDPDKENFYSMDGLDELAANIELVGLQQPLRVRENPDMPGRYLIVSGHRRRAALWTLYEEAPEKWGSVPCIVEPAAASEELQQLRLIYANAGTRQMSSADLSRQAEQVEQLLYKLKEQGFDFPGRMRDHVAEACRVSKTKLATLKVIREKLIPELRQLWEEGTINETCAYKLAQQPEADQIRLTEIKTIGWFKNITEWNIEHNFYVMRTIDNSCCPDGMPCEIKAERQTCDSRPSCCLNCWRRAQCKHACERAKAKVAESRVWEEEQKKLRAEAQAKRKTEEAAANTAAWKRVANAAEAANVGAREIAAFFRGDEPEDVADEEVEETRQRMDGTFRRPPNKQAWDLATYENPLDSIDDAETIIALADLLHCSTDYLLGRAPDPAPAPAEHVPVWKLLKCEGAWKRTITAADAAGVDIKEFLAALFYGGNAEDVRDEDAQAVRDFADGGDAANVTDLPWEFPEELIYVADLLHCSTDYLLGRAPEPTPVPAGLTAEPLQFRSGHPDHDAVCWCIFDYGSGKSGCQQAIWNSIEWRFYNINANIEAECLGWIELPDYEGVLRE